MKNDETAEGPAKEPSQIAAEAVQLLHADLSETSALLRDCAAIARDDRQDIARRLPALTAAAQLARASGQLAKLLREETRHTEKRGVIVHERLWEVPRTSAHPPLQEQLDAWHAEQDEIARENFSKTTGAEDR
jgi:hypothetical protein